MTVPANGPHEYLYGQTPLLTGVFLDPDTQEPVDPDSGTVTFEVTPPGADTLRYIYPDGPDGDVTKDDVGNYSFLQRTTIIENDSAGETVRWYYRVTGSSASLGLEWAEEYWFDVRASLITPYVETSG